MPGVRRAKRDRAEIKDLCAWLRLLVNNGSNWPFARHHAKQSAALATPLGTLGRSPPPHQPVRGAVQPFAGLGAAKQDGGLLCGWPLPERPGYNSALGTRSCRTFLTDWLRDID
jgi:hypothetical protein